MLKKIITRLITCKTLLKIRATIKRKYQCMEFSLPIRLPRFSLAITRVNIFIYLICIPCPHFNFKEFLRSIKFKQYEPNHT